MKMNITIARLAERKYFLRISIAIAVKRLIGAITKSMNSFISGVLNGSSAVDVIKNVSGVIGAQVDTIGAGIKNHLFGSDDGNGNKEGGIFSGISRRWFFKKYAATVPKKPQWICFLEKNLHAVSAE